MGGCSSGTTSVPMTAKFFFLRSSATAGPERSTRSPREQESLTVTTAALIPSAVEVRGVEPLGIEEDIFFFLLGFAAVPLRLIKLAQALHEQPLRIQGSRLLRGLTLEVHLKISVGPPQHLEDGGVPGQRTVNGMGDLAFAKIHFALFVFVGEGEGATLAPHLQRLHQVDHVHLQKAASQYAVGGSGLGHLLQRDLVDHSLDALRSFT